jgi:hypothetical protein
MTPKELREQYSERSGGKMLFESVTLYAQWLESQLSDSQKEVERLQSITLHDTGRVVDAEAKVVALEVDVSTLRQENERLTKEKQEGIEAFYQEHDIVPLDSPEIKAFDNVWAAISHEVWKRDPIVTTLRRDLSEAQTYRDAWLEQYEWLKRLRDSGQRTKAMSALLNMQDIQERVLTAQKARDGE